MAKYVDGFVLSVPKKNLDDYTSMAQKGGEVWKKHGALEYFECVGEDLDPKMEGMKFMKFPELAKAGEDEIVIFSFIVFESREHRDQVNAKVMKDPLMSGAEFKDKPMPFDVSKMAYGGFEAIVSL
ncbi:MAG: protein of unknown function DUF1428 [uncultured bacterium]|nr:MAG: protein of unknown function DUF1428 [uncultured bacterium]